VDRPERRPFWCVQRVEPPPAEDCLSSTLPNSRGVRRHMECHEESAHEPGPCWMCLRRVAPPPAESSTLPNSRGVRRHMECHEESAHEPGLAGCVLVFYLVVCLYWGVLCAVCSTWVCMGKRSSSLF
jgi:hypothetical protein